MPRLDETKIDLLSIHTPLTQALGDSLVIQRVNWMQSDLEPDGTDRFEWTRSRLIKCLRIGLS